MTANIWMWVGFHVFLFGMLALDLGVFHRKAHVVKFKEAMSWTGVWIALALLFNVGIYYMMGPTRAVEFLTGYLIEKSLSVDNIFVILLIFTYFCIPSTFQHKILFWGILGALLFRAIFIFLGIALIQKYHWILYFFGAFLIFTGIKMAMPGKENVDLEKNFAIRMLRKFMPISTSLEGAHFFTHVNGLRMATPLFAALVAVEATDVIFAIDSIPAILAVSSDPFIVYTSNVFAILGLRSLFFAVSGLVAIFEYLKYGLAAILTFVGTKMLIADFYKINPGIALGVIALIMTTAIVASILKPKTHNEGGHVSL